MYTAKAFRRVWATELKAGFSTVQSLTSLLPGKLAAVLSAVQIGPAAGQCVKQGGVGSADR